MSNEIWLPVKHYEGIYEVSSIGNVRPLKVNKSGGNKLVGKTMKMRCQFGYNTVDLFKNGKYKKCSVHRLVAEAFKPNSNDSLQVNHINGIRNDNRLDNLEWVTSKENMNHMCFVLGSIKNMKMTYEKVLFCLSNKDTMSYIQMSQKLGISKQLVGQVIREHRYLPWIDKAKMELNINKKNQAT